MIRKPRWADTWGPQGTRLKTSDKYWKQPLVWNRKAEREGVRYRVFCGSLCDVFEYKDDQPELNFWRAELWELIEKTPFLDWLLLTKRPENVTVFHPDLLPENVWIGTSIENQEAANKRIPELLKIPARVRFLSIEPMLEKALLDDGCNSWLTCDGSNREANEGECCESYAIHGSCFRGIDWVIVGGESGPNARPMNPDWARSIRAQCQEAGIPFFMKQMTQKTSIPDDLFIRQYPQR
jgi:protein gp37